MSQPPSSPSPDSVRLIHSLGDEGLDRFHEQLNRLAFRFPRAADEIEKSNISGFYFNTDLSESLSIGQIQEGKSVWHHSDGGERQHFPGFIQEFEKRLAEPKSRLFFLAGFGSGWFAERLFETIKDHNIGILVIEPNAALFQATLRLTDRTAVLTSGKFFFAVGDSSLEQAAEILRRFHLFVIPEYCLLFSTKSVPEPQRDFYVRWLQELLEKKQSIEREENRKIVEFRNRMRRIASPAIRKVWLYERSPDTAPYTRAQQYLARRFADAIRASGCEVAFPEFPPQTYCPPFAGVPSLIEADPELILIVNTFSTDPYVLGKTFSTHLKIPKLDWFMDAPVIGWDHLKRAGLGYGEILASTDACWFEDVRDACPAMANREAHNLPLAATYEEPGPEDPAWSCDVSYVGQVRNMNFLFANPRLAPRVRTILDRIIQAMLQGKGQRLDRWVRSSPLLAELRAQYDLESFLKTYYLQMIWEANSRYRCNILKPLANRGLRIFGNEDWSVLTANTPLEKCFMGKTVAHEDLPRLFRNSKINVNIHHLQSSTSLNLRVFDVPAAGGFLLTDYMPGLENLFEIGREVVVYRTPEELADKVRYFLRHPDERQEIARRARQRVLRDHTFANRWRQALDILRKEGW